MAVSYPNVVEFLETYIYIDGFSEKCRQMILNELADYAVIYVISRIPGGDSLDMYDIQCLLTYEMFKVYPGIYDISDFSDGIEDVVYDYNFIFRFIRALENDGVSLSRFWTEDETSVSWIFHEKFVYTKSSNKLTQADVVIGEGEQLRKALQEACCPKRELLE